MLVSNRRQRELLADKLLDATNLAVAALFFGQLVTGTPFSFPLALLGAVWCLLAGLAILLTGRRTR
jgi:hypothetical protein